MSQADLPRQDFEASHAHNAAHYRRIVREAEQEGKHVILRPSTLGGKFPMGLAIYVYPADIELHLVPTTPNDEFRADEPYFKAWFAQL